MKLGKYTLKTAWLLLLLPGSHALAQYYPEYPPPSGGYYDPYYPGDYYDPRYPAERDYYRERDRYWREKRELERERDRLEDARERAAEERERLADERRRYEQERSRGQSAAIVPQQPQVELETRCPAGFQQSERKCTQEERRRGCKDIRLNSGIGCVKR